MLLGLVYQLTRFLTDLVLVRTRSDAQLRTEVLALRHQLRVLERKVGRPAWQPVSRVLLAALSQLLPTSAWSALLPKPDTLLRWHRDLVRRKVGRLSAAPSSAASFPRPGIYGMANLRSCSFLAIAAFLGFVFLTHNLLVWTKAVLFVGTRLVAIYTREMVEKIISVPALLVRRRDGLRLELPAVGVLARELRELFSAAASSSRCLLTFVENMGN